MKDLHGSASREVTATPEECISLLAALDRYPDWYPEVIREVQVLERGSDGVPRRARVTVHVTVGPLSRDFHFEVSEEPAASTVVIMRIPHSASDPEQLEIRWGVEPGTLRVDLAARLDVPRLIPVGGLGDSLAQGFIEAASRELDGSSPNASASSS